MPASRAAASRATRNVGDLGDDVVVAGIALHRAGLAEHVHGDVPSTGVGRDGRGCRDRARPAETSLTTVAPAASAAAATAAFVVSMLTGTGGHGDEALDDRQDAAALVVDATRDRRRGGSTPRRRRAGRRRRPRGPARARPRRRGRGTGRRRRRSRASRSRHPSRPAVRRTPLATRSRTAGHGSERTGAPGGGRGIGAPIPALLARALSNVFDIACVLHLCCSHGSERTSPPDRHPADRHRARQRGARCRWRTGPGQWEVHARIERFVEPALLLVLRDGETHGYDLAEALAELAPDDAVDLGNLYRLLRSLEVEGLVVLALARRPARAHEAHVRAHRGGPSPPRRVGAVPAPGRRHRRHVPGALRTATTTGQRHRKGRSGRMSHRRTEPDRAADTTLHEHLSPPPRPAAPRAAAPAAPRRRRRRCARGAATRPRAGGRRRRRPHRRGARQRRARGDRLRRAGPERPAPKAPRAGERPQRFPGCVMRLIASARVAAFVLNEAAHRGRDRERARLLARRASTCRSARPRSSRARRRARARPTSASAIWVVSRSCTCGRLAKPSTSRAIFDRPVMRPSSPGMYATCALPGERHEVVLAHASAAGCRAPSPSRRGRPRT